MAIRRTWPRQVWAEEHPLLLWLVIGFGFMPVLFGVQWVADQFDPLAALFLGVILGSTGSTIYYRYTYGWKRARP